MLKRNLETVPTVLRAGFAPSRGREATTMWQLAIWAYKREAVRICANADANDDFLQRGSNSNTGAVCRILREGIIGSGPVARVRRIAVHADAEWLHGIVSTFDREDYWLFTRTAEAAVPPQWDPEIEPYRIHPVLRANGRPRMIVCPVQKRPVACRITVTGMSDAEATATRGKARDSYRRWFEMLWIIREKLVEEDALSRWRVTAIGAEPTPWVGLM